MNERGRESLRTSMIRWCGERFPNVWALGAFRLAYAQCYSELIFPKSQRRSRGRDVADLPRTNNDLEQYFSSARYYERRAIRAPISQILRTSFFC